MWYTFSCIREVRLFIPNFKSSGMFWFLVVSFFVYLRSAASYYQLLQIDRHVLIRCRFFFFSFLYGIGGQIWIHQVGWRWVEYFICRQLAKYYAEKCYVLRNNGVRVSRRDKLTWIAWAVRRRIKITISRVFRWFQRFRLFDLLLEFNAECVLVVFTKPSCQFDRKEKRKTRYGLVVSGTFE